MKQIIFALSLIMSIIMVGISFAYANATMLVGSVIMVATCIVLLWAETKEIAENKTKMKF